jgi:hypothetical protein
MFRIPSFEQHKHPLLEKRKFMLTNLHEVSTENYFSIVIGPNGTGKSYLLSGIIEAFNEIALMKKINDYSSKKRFTLAYQYKGEAFKITTENRKASFGKAEDPFKKGLSNYDDIIYLSVSKDEIKLPSEWIASSVTINDKYPILNSIRKSQIPNYYYLGIRSASNNAFISRITSNNVLYFIKALKKRRESGLLSVYQALGLSNEVELVFIAGPMLKLIKRLFKIHLESFLSMIRIIAMCIIASLQGIRSS